MLLYEAGMLGITVRVFVDRVEYKGGFISPVDVIPVAQVASIRIGGWLVNRLVVETTGGREYVMVTRRKTEVANAIYQAQTMLRANVVGGYANPMASVGGSLLPQIVTKSRPNAARVVAGVAALFVGVVVLASVGGSGKRKTSAATTSKPTATFDTGNRANDMMLAVTEPEQLAALEHAVEEGCAGTRAFYAGIEPKERTAFWDVACANGSSYRVAVNADAEGSMRILNCLALKAVADLECFISVDAPVTRPPRSKQQILADVARLPPKLKQQVMQQLDKNLREYAASAPASVPSKPAARAVPPKIAASPKARQSDPDDLMAPSDQTTTKQTGTIDISAGDCSSSVVDPTDKNCQKQFCAKHGDDPRCALE